MSMQAVTVDTTAGGVTLLSANSRRRTIALRNTGATDCYLKFDESSTALTAANGYPLKAGESLILGPSWLSQYNSVDLNFAVKGITAAASTTVIAHDVII